jgi:hypothetical protein
LPPRLRAIKEDKVVDFLFGIRGGAGSNPRNWKPQSKWRGSFGTLLAKKTVAKKHQQQPRKPLAEAEENPGCLPPAALFQPLQQS